MLDSYRGYVMTDDYAGYNALALQPGVERLACNPTVWILRVSSRFRGKMLLLPSGGQNKGDELESVLVRGAHIQPWRSTTHNKVAIVEAYLY